ncbi:MAG: hypothetical protein ACRDLU_08565 [Gaiellaceae bacterium]
MQDLPTGTVTFLFTDIEGSTHSSSGRPRVDGGYASGRDLDLDDAVSAALDGD